MRNLRSRDKCGESKNCSLNAFIPKVDIQLVSYTYDSVTWCFRTIDLIIPTYLPQDFVKSPLPESSTLSEEILAYRNLRKPDLALMEFIVCSNCYLIVSNGNIFFSVRVSQLKQIVNEQYSVMISSTQFLNFMCSNANIFMIYP